MKGRYLVCGFVRGAKVQMPVCQARCHDQEGALALAESWMQDYSVQVVDTYFMEDFLAWRERSLVGVTAEDASEGRILQ